MRDRKDELRLAKGGELTREETQHLMLDIFDLGYEKSDGESAHWQEYALCAQTDPDLFFPEKGGSTAPATSICHRCPVRDACLEYALENDIRHGIWGGMSDNDRRRITRERRRRANGA